MTRHLNVGAIGLGLVLSLVATLAAATPTAAECLAFQSPARPTMSDFARYAFVATVTDASRTPGAAPPGNAPFDWHVEMAVERVYVGDVPDTITSDGWSVGCASLRGDQLRTGDHLFVMSSALPRGSHDLRWRGDTLVWISTDRGWHLYRRAISLSGEFSGWPREALGYLTTARLAALAAGLPATDAPEPDPRDAPDSDSVLPLVAAGFALVRVLLRIRGGIGTRIDPEGSTVP
ncbi:MAG: hypothetical protein KF809_09460 [Chloroflexi bacterium]|nr:hypothetical protein [Chloroflexota bacterium]